MSLREGIPYLLSFLSGLLLWASFPEGGNIQPLLAVALVPLLFAVTQVTKGKSLYCGLIVGIVHYLSQLYWIVIVVGKYGGLPWFLALQALVLLSIYMSLYLSLFAFLARVFITALPLSCALLLIPALWVGFDWFRGFFLTGFPWMDLGYALHNMPRLIQIADLVGHHGITYCLVLINVAIFLLALRPLSLKKMLFVPGIVCVLLAAAGYYSVTRYQEIREHVGTGEVPVMRFGIVQGNMDQSVKWSPEKQQETVQKYLAASMALAAGERVSLLVWPETALPFYPPSNPAMEPLKMLVQQKSLGLLTGAPWYEIVDKETRKINFFNSALLLTPSRLIEQTYFKRHLVPFGEYVPLKKYFPFIEPLVEAVGDFSPGQKTVPVIWREAKIGVLICFESVFPGLSREWALRGANVLVNLTNDAWYGKSSAPYQSLAMAVFRAVETRRSMVRSANTGISAFISPAGDIKSQSPLFHDWAAAEDIVLLEEVTLWVRFGYLFGLACMVASLAGITVVVVRKSWT